MPFPSIPHKHVLRFHIRFRAWGSEILIAIAHTTYNASRGSFEGSDGWELVYRYVVDPSISSNTWVLQHSSEHGVDFRAWITGGPPLDWLSGEGTAVLQVSRLYGQSIQEVGELKWTTGGGKTSDKVVIATSNVRTAITSTSITTNATTTATDTAETSTGTATTSSTSATTSSTNTLATTSSVETSTKTIMDINASSSRDCEGVWSSWSACSTTCGAGGWQQA